MLVSRDIAARADQMIASCGLDSLSIFFSAQSQGATDLTYLFHHGVSEEAQHAYKDGRVFEEDPFTRVIDRTDRCGRMIRWGEDRLDRVADGATEYRQFINCHSVDVVGAWVQQVLPDFYLLIGAHCHPDGHRKSDVAHGLLERESAAISQMVVSQLFEDILVGAGGRGTLQAALSDSGPAAGGVAAKLSSRELQIAQLIGAGKQNKQVAFIAGISEFTVENHLRRIYRKLDVHNRAAMTAKIFGGH
ncbi:helix-turn-helix transcriptional regulator [Sphingopyxis sp. J-6]|uniref:helix-turn-helix transcriptional regulator n=1 Tax=Sphingopyxis sp. J-6 TaxID=3122054 RepID=UPI0039840B42